MKLLELLELLGLIEHLELLEHLKIIGLNSHHTYNTKNIMKKYIM
jgi:hypothetical protein